MRPNLLYRAGELNEQLWHFFADNSRIPDLIWGDLQAMMSGLALLDRRTPGTLRPLRHGLVPGKHRRRIALSERKARQAIARLTPGRYSFSDYLETYRGDGHIFMHAQMTVEGDTLAMDFSGSDPQVLQAVNFSTSERAHPFLCMPIINFIQTVEPTIR